MHIFVPDELICDSLLCQCIMYIKHSEAEFSAILV